VKPGLTSSGGVFQRPNKGYKVHEMKHRRCALESEVESDLFQKWNRQNEWHAQVPAGGETSGRTVMVGLGR